MVEQRFKNTILAKMDGPVLERLQLKPVTLERDHQLEVVGEEIDNLFFLEDGVGSMTTLFNNGAQVEVGMFGWESVIGSSVLMGTRRSLNNVYMQVPGHGYQVSTARGKAEFGRGELFHDLILRYLQAQLVQTAQSAGCNARHPLEQRLARWLLLVGDRSESNWLNLTQEFLSMMLGVERPALSVTAHKLQDMGLIEYHRGKVCVLDRKALEAQACECYEVVRHYLNSYAVTDSGGGKN